MKNDLNPPNNILLANEDTRITCFHKKFIFQVNYSTRCYDELTHFMNIKIRKIYELLKKNLIIMANCYLA